MSKLRRLLNSHCTRLVAADKARMDRPATPGRWWLARTGRLGAVIHNPVHTAPSAALCARRDACVANWSGKQCWVAGRRSALGRTVGVDSDRRQNEGFMMGWTEADGEALFRQPSDERAGEGVSSGLDGQP